MGTVVDEVSLVRERRAIELSDMRGLPIRHVEISVRAEDRGARPVAGKRVIEDGDKGSIGCVVLIQLAGDPRIRDEQGAVMEGHPSGTQVRWSEVTERCARHAVELLNYS